MENKKEILTELMKWTLNINPIISSTLNYMWFIIYVCLISFTIQVGVITVSAFDYLILLVILTHLVQNVYHYSRCLRGFFVYSGAIALFGILPQLSVNTISFSISFTVGCIIAYLIGSTIQFLKTERD